jgi:UDP:flavonoid glycosyltransferase YjiC (YdhE family)
MPTVALYVSGHGYGHAVRAAEVASALLRRDAQVVVRSDAPRWLFPAEAVYVRGESVDVGVAQRDGLELDVDDTRRRWAAFATAFEQRAEGEAALLHERRVNFVLGDIPPLAFAAACHAGVPSAALANFGWDWIYAAWPAFDEAIACVRHGYCQADVLLRLPLHSTDADAFPAFRVVDDVPLIARRGRRPRRAVRAELGLDASARVVLYSFGAFTADGLNLRALGDLREHTFVLTPPLSSYAHEPPGNVVCLGEPPADYVSLLAACDAVVTKPGYGIVADCLANHTAVLFTSRGPFREYDVLAEALQKLGRACFVSHDDLLAGQIKDHLAALESLPDTWTDMPMNGADVVADRILKRLSARGGSA